MLFVVGLLLVAVNVGFSADSEKQRAPLLSGLSDHHYPITTRSARAQQFFNQGLRLVYGFNHAEAIRAFKEAARLDSQCAMAHWGVALSLGPNINAPMNREAELRAGEAMQQALSRKKFASEKERALIDALAKRYSMDEKAARAALDRAYANAMRALRQRYPKDVDIATLFAEALMNLRPWNYWTKDGHPHPGTTEMVATLEAVLRQNPNHPGAIHYYIHAMEASKYPERAVPHADRLGKVTPGAGHLVHMPAHVYIHVGRYGDASASNLQAIAADERYIQQCKAQGLYPLVYYPHNLHFLYWGASMEGRSKLSIEAAQKLAMKVLKDELPDPKSCACCRKPLVENAAVSEEPDDALAGFYGPYQDFLAAPFYAMTRFGKWSDVLQKPPPPAKFPYLTGAWHYARGMALRGQGRLQEATEELNHLRTIAAEPSLKTLDVWGSPAANILAVAAEVLAGEIAAKQKDFDKAVSHLERGVRLEEALAYTEPPAWHYPVRQSLGAVLLEAGRLPEAEVVYAADLKRNRDNGWSLFGLMKALQAQGRTDEAAEMEKRFRKAWKNADVTLTASRF
jgi:tetratricopeptide (TPR) repeat protein